MAECPVGGWEADDLTPQRTSHANLTNTEKCDLLQRIPPRFADFGHGDVQGFLAKVRDQLKAHGGGLPVVSALHTIKTFSARNSSSTKAPIPRLLAVG